VEVLLQAPLMGHPAALGEQPVAVQGRGRLGGDQPVGHHGVGLQERSNHLQDELAALLGERC
jgi:hypothetical protein